MYVCIHCMLVCLPCMHTCMCTLYACTPVHQLYVCGQCMPVSIHTHVCMYNKRSNVCIVRILPTRGPLYRGLIACFLPKGNVISSLYPDWW